MTYKKLTIITCFSYTGNRKYVFNPQYLRSDLRRIISFSQNRIGCALENTYVITDLCPTKELQDEILNDFCNEVIKYLRDLGIFYGSYDVLYNMSPLKWLRNLCKQISPCCERKANAIYDKVVNTILPIVRSSNVVEFVSLFTNFILVTGKTHFDQTLENLFSQPISNLFFYYTGHGIRLWSDTQKRQRSYEICLVIPGTCSSAEFYSRQDLQKRFNQIINRIPSFIVFDCCHAETILEFPFKMTFSNETDDLYISNTPCQTNNLGSVYLSSTRNNQTCGFYISNLGQYGGSLFTYHLIHFLDDIAKRRITSRKRNILDLSRLREVEEQVQEYRKLAEKKPQNISIGLSEDSTTQFPLWLFDNIASPRFQLVEEDE